MAARYSLPELHRLAKQAEQDSDVKQAIDYYQRSLKLDPMDDVAYHRLMVLYRREKEYRKELTVIDAAIKAHLDDSQRSRREWLNQNKKQARLAKQLMTSLGLLDQKGKETLESSQVSTWKKRREVVTSRIKSSKK